MGPSTTTQLSTVKTMNVGDVLSRSAVRVVTVDDAWILSSTMVADRTVGVPTSSPITPAASSAVTAAVVTPETSPADVTPAVSTAAVTTAVSAAVVAPPVSTAVVTPPVAAAVLTPPVTTAVVTPPVAAVVVKPQVSAAVATPQVTAAVVTPPVVASVVTPPVASKAVTPAVAAVAIAPFVAEAVGTPGMAAACATGTTTSTSPTAATTTIPMEEPKTPQTATPTAPPAGTPTETPAVAASTVQAAARSTSSARSSAMPHFTMAAPKTAAAAALAAAFSSAGGAAARARARAATNGISPEARRVGKYLSAFLGTRASEKPVSDIAALIGLSGRIEDNNAGLRFVVHASGVSPAGDLGWASLYGEERTVDPDVLRVFGQAHAFACGREVLTRSGLPDGSPLLPLVGTNHRGGLRPAPSALPPRVPSAEDEEYLDTMKSPADNFLAPSVGIQRLARQVARARSASQSSAEVQDERPLKEGSGSASASGEASVASASASASAMEVASLEQGGVAAAGRPIDGSAISRAAGGLLPFVLETVRPPLPHNPSKSVTSFLTDLFLNRRAPVQLL